MKKIILGLLMAVNLYSNAQPSIQWQKCLGGSSYDNGLSIQQTSDGGYILTGFTYSNDGDVSGNHSNVNLDAWVVKLSSLGVIEWQKCLGGSGGDGTQSIQQTSDGGYILTGESESNNGDVSGNHGGTDAWVVKLSSLGIIEWQKCLGGSGTDIAYSIRQISDGGYIIIGKTGSNNGDVSGNHGNEDAWVVKLSSLGVIVWQKCLGGSSYDNGQSIQQTSDGGYILTGFTYSNDGDVSGNHSNVNYDAWVVKLSSLGVIEWQKCLGGNGEDFGYSIQQTSDGGYILTGESESNNGDVSGNHGGTDAWVVKLSSLGIIEWQKCLGGSGGDGTRSIQHTSDGGYILSGSTTSNDGDVSGHNIIVNYDAWVVKLSSLGVIEWQKCLGGNGEDFGYSIQQTSDGGYIVSGATGSNNGDVSGNHGEGDLWVVKLSSFLGLEKLSYNNLVTLYPNPVTNLLNVKVDNNFENLNYRLIDVEGKIINQGLINENITVINVEHLSKGVYFIKVSDNTAIKFIKE